MATTKEKLMVVLDEILNSKEKEMEYSVGRYDAEWLSIELDHEGWTEEESDRSAMWFTKESTGQRVELIFV